MEHRPPAAHQAHLRRLGLYIDPLITQDESIPALDLSDFDVVPLEEAQFALLKKGQRLWANFPDGEYTEVPFYGKNIRTLMKNFRTYFDDRSLPVDVFEGCLKTTQGLEKKLFSNVTLSPEENIKDLWDEIIKKVNAISAESHSLNGLVEKILEIPFLQKFHTSLLVLHLKGQTKAEILGVMFGDHVRGVIEVKDFNTFFTSVKKSKIKSFGTEDFPKVNLPFNGSFLANEVLSKKYSLIAVVSRHDFLAYSKEEIELYETCIDLLQPHLERLIDQEFSDKRISELRICLKDFPLPLRIKNSVSGTAFMNDLYRAELQDHDIFFNKKIQGPFTLDLYDSDELRHYAFDLFHFQRISLLGELLNTLRHELSNPLFGLKLSSQIFATFEVDADTKEMMREIEKNVNRCQVIIENFSNLYQIQSEEKPASLKKMIDESLVLAKSEAREVMKKVTYLNGTDQLFLQVPIIFVVQILFNLIVNSAQALKNHPGAKELTLTVDQTESGITIDVQDSGLGIPEDKLQFLFKPFFTTKKQGTGLGLILSRNLALKMGGNLEYLDHNTLKGAHFRLTLPRT